MFEISKGQLSLLNTSVFSNSWEGLLLWRKEHMVALFFCLPKLYSFLPFYLMSLKLLDNEQVVYTLKKTPLIWITPFLLGFFFYWFFTAHTPTMPTSPWMTLVGLVLLVLCVVEIIRRYRYAWYVTNKRIVLHFWLFLHEREMRFEQLEWVQVERYKAIFWHQVHISWTGGTSTLFDYVSNYDDFKTAIYDTKEKSKVSNPQ